MPEIEIKRTNFFDGEFLKQGEFLDMDLYHVHMRRRLLFLLFDKSGVVQASPTDLTLVADVGPAQIRVKAGMAIGRRPDLAESKEIVVRDDQVISLSPTLGAGDTGVLTVHYNEQPAVPSSEGGVLGNKRILEQAIITVHKTQIPGPNAANGEPFVRLGTVIFDTLAVSPPRDVAFLQGALLAATPAITIIPNSVPAAATTPLAVTSSGGLNLSTLTAAQVSIAPPDGIGIAVSSQTPNSATITLTVPGAVSGPHTLTVLGATTNLTVQAGQAVISVQGVDQPNADLLFKVNGSSFTSPMELRFTSTAGPGTFTSPVFASTVTAAQGLFPLAQIQTLNNRTRGPIQVTSGGPAIVSAFDVEPPAQVTTMPASKPRNTVLSITGACFFTGVTIRLLNALGQVMLTKAPPTFPDPAFGESRTDTALNVFLPASLAPGQYTVTIQNLGGTIVGGPLTVTL